MKTKDSAVDVSAPPPSSIAYLALTRRGGDALKLKRCIPRSGRRSGRAPDGAISRLRRAASSCLRDEARRLDGTRTPSRGSERALSSPPPRFGWRYSKPGLASVSLRLCDRRIAVSVSPSQLAVKDPACCIRDYFPCRLNSRHWQWRASARPRPHRSDGHPRVSEGIS